MQIKDFKSKLCTRMHLKIKTLKINNLMVKLKIYSKDKLFI